MLRSKLRNRYLKLKTEITYSEYKKQRNVCTSLLRKAKRDYFRNLDPSNVTDNKKFWRAIKPLFSEKTITKENIILVEKNVHNKDSNVALPPPPKPNPQPPHPHHYEKVANNSFL